MINHIKELCNQRGWTYYKLAQEAKIPYSSLNTMMNKMHIPSMKNLIKICNGFDITLAQFFGAMAADTEEQKDLIRIWNTLDEQSKELAKSYMYGLARMEVPENNK